MSGPGGASMRVAAIALALLTGGCVREPRFLAAWYVTPEVCNRPVTILLVNSGRKATAVTNVALNALDGPRLDVAPTAHPLMPGEKLELSPLSGGTAKACGQPTVASPTPPPTPTPERERNCLPIRLFVTTGTGPQRPRQVDIDRPLPNAFATEAFVPCR